MWWNISRDIYLDWASAAPVLLSARTALTHSLAYWGNPSSPHEKGRQAREQLEHSRATLARLTGVKADRVVFTSGATEANNLALLGRCMALQSQGMPYDQQHVLYLPTMHASVRQTIGALEGLGVVCEPLSFADGHLSLTALSKQLRHNTVLVCVDAVCGETGIRFPVRKIAQCIAGARAHRARLHVDATQLPLIDSVERMRLKADTMTLDAQKVGGVRGVGALIGADPRSLSPILHGGGQEQGLRPGTEPVALIDAFVTALVEVQKGYERFAKQAARDRLTVSAILQQAIADTHITQGQAQAPHILTLSLPGIDTDYLVMLLSEARVYVGTKSACETDRPQGSRPVYLITGSKDLATTTLRISWGPITPSRDLTRAAHAIARAVRFLKTSGVY